MGKARKPKVTLKSVAEDMRQLQNAVETLRSDFDAHTHNLSDKTVLEELRSLREIVGKLNQLNNLATPQGIEMLVRNELKLIVANAKACRGLKLARGVVKALELVMAEEKKEKSE